MAFRAIDLFAGGGGLTVGLQRAGFDVVAAVENDKYACATYRANHPNVSLLEKDITQVSEDDVRELVGSERIDLLAGCPPCQGYTSLNRYKNEDPRNELVSQMSRWAKILLPRVIMVENVPGLTIRGKQNFSNLKNDLKELGYEFEDSTAVLQAADFGVPQHRRRLVLLAGFKFKVELPDPTHSKYESDGLPSWKSVRDTIGIAAGLGEPITLPEAKQQESIQLSNWHIVRQLSPVNVERLKKAVPGKSWEHIPENIRPTCHQGGYRGFSNVYGRMEWSEPSPTITAGCTTFSKGRFGHPEENRTISVREAALLQTFPMDYKFQIPYMEHVCNVIGNALPCTFAEALAKQCHAALTKAEDKPQAESDALEIP